MIVAALATYALSTSKQAFDLILSVGAGTGLIYLLRWFWWRVNAWCEVAAMVSSFLVALGFASPPGKATRCRGTSRSSSRSPPRPSCGGGGLPHATDRSNDAALLL